MTRAAWLVGLALSFACGAPAPLPPVAATVVPATQQPGPVPDYAPMAAIVAHVESRDLAPDLSPLLARLLGAAFRVDRRMAELEELPEKAGPDDSLLWLRDYQPIFVRDEAGKLSALAYLSENPNRSEARGLAPASIATRTLPLLHENGNLVVAGRLVIVTDHLFTQNQQDLRDEHLLRAGYRPRGRDEVLRLLARNLHRRVEDIVVLPKMPFEPTGHVDVFVLALDDKRVAVPAIEDRGLALREDDAARNVGRVIQVFLDEQAAHLASLGLEVARPPMIAPALALNDGKKTDAEAHVSNLDRVDTGDVELRVFTPANTLLAHVGSQRIAVIPDFSSIADDPKQSALIAEYAASWTRTLRARGWTPYGVDASDLVGHLGLVRCVTASLPQ